MGPSFSANAHRRRALDHQPPGRVIKAQEVLFRAWGCIEHVRERHRCRRREGRDSRRLHRDIERVLQHARRQHVAHQFRRHRADPDLTGIQPRPIGSDQTVRWDFNRQPLALCVVQACAAFWLGCDDGILAGVHRLQDRLRQSGQIHGRHPQHREIGHARCHLRVQDHLREVRAEGRIRRRLSVHNHFHIARRDGREEETAIRAGGDDFFLTTEQKDFHSLDRQHKNIIQRV